MKISIGSGKGGTGKTTIATSLALALSRWVRPVQLIDCDVEEPNAAIFIKPLIEETQKVSVMRPEINSDLCNYCGACADFCCFHALVVFPTNILTFPEMCHSCTGCIKVCPLDAIKPSQKEIGIIEYGEANGIQFAHGQLNIGEARATPIIAWLQSFINPTRLTILDAPPGTSCPFVVTIRQSDLCILVTEPTPFGLNDLKLAVEVTELLNIPRGVIINRFDIGDDQVEAYCKEKGIEILMKIPHDRSIARAYSDGTPLINAKPEYENLFLELYPKLIGMKRE